MCRHWWHWFTVWSEGLAAARQGIVIVRKEAIPARLGATRLTTADSQSRQSASWKLSRWQEEAKGSAARGRQGMNENETQCAGKLCVGGRRRSWRCYEELRGEQWGKTKVGGCVGGLWCAKQEKNGSLSNRSLLEKQKQITAKSHNKAPLSLPKYLQPEQLLCILGACSKSGRRAVLSVLITLEVSNLQKRLAYVRKRDGKRDRERNRINCFLASDFCISLWRIFFFNGNSFLFSVKSKGLILFPCVLTTVKH